MLGKLLALFRDGAPGASRQRRLAAVVGPPGSGTSTLALQAAHILAPRFRDGQMLLHLRDDKGVPLPAAELVDDLLDLLEPFPRRSPAAVGGRSAMLRSRLAGLQMLLILDGVGDEAQARPLLPGTGDCSVILTSCRTLSGLDGVSRFPVGVFTEDEAMGLLSRIIGAERVERARPAALRIVRACGLLPLAVRIAGARLADLDQLPLDRFADRLEDEDRLLDESRQRRPSAPRPFRQVRPGSGLRRADGADARRGLRASVEEAVRDRADARATRRRARTDDH